MHELGSADGYAVIVQLRQRPDGAFDLLEGTVHPPLHRLERGGLVATKWGTAAPCRRQVHRLTPDQHAALRTKTPPVASVRGRHGCHRRANSTGGTGMTAHDDVEHPREAWSAMVTAG
jgi:DNA-binding PadR family transcriptional regulator